MNCGITVVVLMGLLVFSEGGAADPSPLRLIQTIPLPNVEGRIDHLAVDVHGRRLFVAALGNNTVEVVGLNEGKQIHSIAGLREPQGVGFIPDANKIFVANGQGGACDIFDGVSFKRIKSVKFSDDADNVRYDSAAQRVYVGYGNGALGMIDAASGEGVGNITLDGHPESFQLEKSGPRIFVNIPTAQKIAVVDREKRSPIASWPLADAKANFPMALDEERHRLFVVARKPAKLIVLDTESGRRVAAVDAPGDADDVFYNAATRQIYISGGDGSIGVFQQEAADRYAMIGKIPTASGARTSLLVPELDRFYLAVPHRGKQTAEIRVYEPGR